MNTEAQVRQARNPQEAMLAIAKALDHIEQLVVHEHETAEDWLKRDWRGTSPTISFEQATKITGDADHTDVVIPAPTPEKQERRRLFEQQCLHLGEHLGAGEDWTDAYAKGGPRWLYYGNRDLVMSYPDATKAAMIDDIAEDSAQEAHEIARDLLKKPCETGISSTGMRVADGDLG